MRRRIAIGILLAIWTLLPIYNMILIALDDDAEEYTGRIWPSDPSFASFAAVWTQDHWYLEHFWHQFGNSIFIGLMTMGLTVLIGSLTSFALGRLRRQNHWFLGNVALLTYVLPASLLAIPFVHVAHVLGLSDSLWAVIAAQTMFACPYAILIFRQYGRLIPLELDDAAKVDGATPIQIYLRIYLPLMAPALIAVGTYALLLAWNEYLYQFLLLSSTGNMTVAVALDQFFDSDEAPWNYMMAVALIYSFPPIAIFFGLRRTVTAGLVRG